jgi:hypothetical protein
MWHDETLTICEIARALGVSESTVTETAKRFGLDERTRIIEGGNDPPPVDEDEDLASCESLRLAPSVAAAAAEVRRSWSDEERYQRRVTKVQPVTYDTVFR